MGMTVVNRLHLYSYLLSRVRVSRCHGAAALAWVTPRRCYRSTSDAQMRADVNPFGRKERLCEERGRTRDSAAKPLVQAHCTTTKGPE